MGEAVYLKFTDGREFPVELQPDEEFLEAACMRILCSEAGLEVSIETDQSFRQIGNEIYYGGELVATIMKVDDGVKP